MKPNRVVAWVLCAAPMVLAADSHVGRPSSPGEVAPETRSAPAEPTDGSPSQAAEERQWQQVESWMKEHCPNRMSFLQKMPAAHLQFQARRRMIEGYMQIQRVQYPTLRQALIAQLEAQDQIFGAQVEMRQATRRGDPALQSKADADLRTAIGHLFDAQQARRHARLQQLKEETKRVGDELERQDRLHDQLIENWFNNMKSNAARMPGGRPQNASPDDTSRPSDEK